ncbi:MAG: orotidine-5'-phosphate decarboxylase [Beijerinckiaceae bacterium]|nr:orotidine-5'-phosphate decarboxylase [Beijerinckiaceae bacterium]
MSSGITPVLRDKLIVALDVSSPEEASDLVARLGDSVSFYKIGLELAFGGGLPLAERLAGAGKKVFLDLKLHDIATTVERAAAQVARLGATYLTVHAFPQTMAAAKQGVGDSGLLILGVTVMTSYDDQDLKAAGYLFGVRHLVERRALQARQAEIGGLILSAEELPAIRELVGPDLRLVTPGIRPAGSSVGDQKRVMTPANALRAGADHLVIGRPITRAADPRAVADAILAEMAGA